MEPLKISKVKFNYKLVVDDGINLVFGLKTTFSFYFNDGKRSEVIRYNKGNRLQVQLKITDMTDDKRNTLMSDYINSPGFRRLEDEELSFAMYELVDGLKSKDFVTEGVLD